MQHRLISPVSVSPVTGYQVYWSGDRGYDSGNVSAGADERTVPITGRTPGLTYNITIVALSDHLPSAVVGAVMVTLGETQILKRGCGQLLCHSCCHKHHSQLQHVLK